MDDFLLLWLSLSISGSLVAFALIILRPFLRRLSKTWQYYIWLLVILRLLVPISPDINLVGSLFQQAGIHFSAQDAPVETFSEGGPLDLPAPSNAPSIKRKGPQNPPTASAVFFPWKVYILFTVWLSAAVFFLLQRVSGYRRLTEAVRKESQIVDGGELPITLQRICTEMGIKKKILLCTNPLVRAPMLIGIMSPMIVLPSRAVPPSELAYIFRHELTHYRRMDFLYKWLAEITVCLHWFNPLAYWIRKQINKDCEFSCDEMVVSRLDAAERHTYGDTLLNSIDIKYIGKKDIVSLSLTEDGRLIKERLCAIMQYKQKSKIAVLSATVLTSLLFCGTVFAGAYTPAPARQNDKTGQTVVYTQVEMRKYEGEDGHPYIHDIKINNTSRKITGYQRGMLAFDKEGNPLKIDWWSIDTDLDSEYFYLYENHSSEIDAGETDDAFGGWSLNLMGNDLAAAEIAYVLFCHKEITFEDGAVWDNPDFENWRSAYEGKKIDVADLESYYPYEQTIVFDN